MESPEVKAAAAGVDDIARVDTQFSDPADVVRDVQAQLDQLFDVEKYAETLESFPTDMQMSFYQQMWSLLDAADQILSFMQARAQQVQKGAVGKVVPRPVNLESVADEDSDTAPDGDAVSKEADKDSGAGDGAGKKGGKSVKAK